MLAVLVVSLCLVGSGICDSQASLELGALASQAWRAGDMEGCIHYNRQRIELNPKDGNAFQNLGAAYYRKGDLLSAAEALETACTLMPKDEASMLSLGMAYEHLGQTGKALATYQRAARNLPKSAKAHNHVAGTLRLMGDMDGAQSAFKAAIAADPHMVDAMHNLGSLLLAQQKYGEARPILQRALKIDTSDGATTSAVNMVLLLGRIAAWDDLEALLRTDMVEHARSTPSVKPFHAMEFRLLPKEARNNARAHSRHAASLVQSLQSRLESRPKLNQVSHRFVVGYVSGTGFEGHTTTARCLQTAIGLHKYPKEQVVCVAATAYDPASDVQSKIHSSCGQWIDISTMSHLEAANAVRSAGVHVLVDLSGHTIAPVLPMLALRPAPLQLHWHGFPGSIGADYIDWLLTDKISTPVEHIPLEMHEKVLLLPSTYMISDHRFSRREVLQASASSSKMLRKQQGFMDDDIILASFNQFYKITLEVFAVWMRVMTRCPRCKLWFILWSPEAPANIKGAARKYGIDDSRLVFHATFPEESEFKIKGIADVFLDTPLFNAHTTATDVLWSGVPILTLPGNSTAQRVAAGLCLGTSLQGTLVVRNLLDYEDVLQRLVLVHKTRALRDAKTKLQASRESDKTFDVPLLMDQVRTAQRMAWELHVNKHRKYHAVVSERVS